MFLKTVRDFHLAPTTYSVDDSAMKEFILVDDELRKIDKKANFGYVLNWWL